MALPVDVRDLVKSGTKLVAEREQPVRLAVFVEVDAPDVLVDAVRGQLRPATAAATLQIEVVESEGVSALVGVPDAVIAVAGSGGACLSAALGAARRVGVPVVTVALGDETRALFLSDGLLQPTADVLAYAEPSEVIDRLGVWMADTLGSKRLALAHNFAFMRRAVAEDAVKTTAWQNALVGAVALIPGADMPIMTANQAKMLLQIAAAYGQPLGVDRIKELAAVVGGGFVFRAIARQTLAVVPVFGWAVKGGIGYTGTVAMGRAAIEYFEDGADLGQVATRLKVIRDKAATRLPMKARRALPVGDQLALPVSDDEGAGV